MSNIVLSPNASGTGSLTIAAPNTNTNRTLTLPDTTGTILTNATTAGFPAGSVLQVVQSTYSTPTSTTSTSFASTGLTATITPTSATSKILVIAVLPVFNTGYLTYASWLTIYRGTVSGTNLGAASYGLVEIGVNSSAVNLSAGASMAYLDSPTTSSAQTYTAAFRSENASNTVTVCRNSGVATMILMEIAA